ncbi:MAG TPA: tetratricopeptide repeat protein [Bacteroidetes bacterium]|nr:tetratricopeptide repeat protein [Bacteroidota bacterium]
MEPATNIIDSRLKQLDKLEQLASKYLFTNIQEAQKYLAELKLLLEEVDNRDFMMKYHLHTAIVENQLYNYDLSVIHFIEAIDLLNERGGAIQLAEAYIDYSGTLINLGNVDEAYKRLEDARKFLQVFPDERLEAYTLCRRGYLHLRNSNPPKALQSFYEAENLLKGGTWELTIKDQYFFTLVKSGIGRIHAINHEPVKSIQAYLDVVKICEEQGMRSRLSWHYLNVGNSYMAAGDDENAIKYFKLGIKVIDDVNQEARALAYANLGSCLLRKGLFQEGLDLLERAYPLFKAEGNSNLATLEWSRGRAYEGLNKRKKALRYYFKALEFAQKAGGQNLVAGILKDIATYYAREEDFKNAYEYQKRYDKAIEKAMQELKDYELRELEIKYRAEMKQSREEMYKLQATGLQLKALRAQMNPHFVFNALNSVQNFITSNDPSLAAKYLAQFAHLMRQSLENSDQEIISLEKEIEFLRNYLDINVNLRFVNKLTYNIHVDEEIEEDISGVPTMIIQPYVENAIEHGIRPKKKGHINIEFKLKDDDVILCIVEDNGVGREKTARMQEANGYLDTHKSLGTKITRERLEILNTKNGTDKDIVKITDLYDPITREAIGTRVEILIPILEFTVK